MTEGFGLAAMDALDGRAPDPAQGQALARGYTWAAAAAAHQELYRSLLSLPASFYRRANSEGPSSRSSATEPTPSSCMVRLNCSARMSSALSTPASPPAIRPYR